MTEKQSEKKATRKESQNSLSVECTLDTEQPWCKSVCEGGHYMCELDKGHEGPHRVIYSEKSDYIWTDDNPVARSRTQMMRNKSPIQREPFYQPVSDNNE